MVLLVEERGFLYEINEKGERILVRSTESNQRAFLRFTNKTSRPVDVWWRDFRGKRHHYISLNPCAKYDINSYVSHPWEFTDMATKERYVINNREIYRAPANLGGMLFRTNWNITVRVRSLQHIALLSLAELYVSNPFRVNHLGLPRTLEIDLREMITKLRYGIHDTDSPYYAPPNDNDDDEPA